MKIGIDISQMVHEGTGVARYVRELTRTLIESDSDNTYVLFGASLRKRYVFHTFVKNLSKHTVRLVAVPIPPTILDILWNRLHIIPVEWFIGKVDIFWSSDWTQPPIAYAQGITTVHDISFMKFPEEHAKQIRDVHKRRLFWVKKECEKILCDSEATKNDVKELLEIPENKLQVVYPGFSRVE